MRDYLAKLPTKIGILLAIPLMLMAYPVVMILVPAVVHRMVPDVVRSVLRLM